MNEQPLFSNWYKLEQLLSENFPEQALKVKGYVGYYSSSGLCISKFYKSQGEDGNVNPVTSAIILFNFIAMMYIMGAYVAIYKHAKAPGPQRNITDKKLKQLRKIQRKIAMLIATDMCCWLPICIMTFISMSGVSLPSTAYAESAIILLPINSSLDPIIYANWEECCTNSLQESCHRLSPTSSSLWKQVPFFRNYSQRNQN
ncbi:unnamed protein product [Clavelina lepadiformis]|uniref:G-protein coupled receptors family 1 profile domain-containing protein n=1 Tax=Clavelina lepadiformis TaxID=159417 RepID=A0ABP0FAC4_CLALP